MNRPRPPADRPAPTGTPDAPGPAPAGPPGAPGPAGHAPAGPAGTAARPRGLTQEEAVRLLAEHGPNEVGRARRIPLWSRVVSQLRDPLIVVLLAAVVLTLVTRDHTDATIIALVIVFNTAVGVAQEVRADNAVAALSALSAPTARVVRDGAEHEVPAAGVVPGDVLLLGEGDVVPADADLVEASALLVDESALTGESVPVDKDAAAAEPEAARLQAGTVVLRGRAVAAVTATGAASALGRIAALLHPRVEQTPLQRRLAGLGRVLAVVATVLCVLVFALGLARGQSAEVMAVTAISLAVAAVPESLPAVVTLSLALGARRMAARRAVVRRLPAVETLGSVTVLATDKTGTLTEGRMVVERLWTPRGTEAEVTGTGYGPSGELLVGGRPPGPEELDRLRELLTAAVLCNDAALRPPGPGRDDWTALGDPTEAALLAAGVKAGCDREALLREHPRAAEVPFESSRKRMTTLHRAPSDRVLVCLKGAPEAVLDPDVLREDAGLLESAAREAARLASAGHRVLAVASGLRDDLPRRPEDAETGLRLLGLAAIDDPPKEAAAATVAACHRAGITPVLITGDHPATARAVAARVGILPSPTAEPGPPAAGSGAAGAADDTVVTGRELAAGEVADPTRVRILARTSPEQKLDIVRAWQARGEVTAMTGDGVNDGPALRQADIGVAMGHRGTEVARQAADLVLADDELGTVVSAVEEGRRVYDNIRRFLVYGMAGGAAEILVMLAGPFFGLVVPLRAGQILWVNLLTHGLTGVAMGAEPVSRAAMNRPPRPPQEHVLGAGLWQRVVRLGVLVTVASLAAGLWAREAGRPWQSVLFLSLLAAQLGVVTGLRDRLRTRENPFLPVAVAASAALGLAAVHVPLLRTYLATVPLDGTETAVAAAVGLVGFAGARAESASRRRSARAAARAAARTPT
ncbi:cation-translocating P-type ATPase [Streptomyces sp. HB2AG]|uniref:cation-translocating P-type ATPase n=1 Tax=Streptomyces sp. HB2AG TaxID=2983400 RepID=UPI0022AA033C|nr:cation-translocating P-type ATPase [Streptomyces sp. HB2AG]MCZ2525044.1 cation-translocating P-type ATPase [Streptomyces sp. HB2AG]